MHIFDRYNSAGTEYRRKTGLEFLNDDIYLPWGIKPLEAGIITDFQIKALTKYSYSLSPSAELFFDKKYRLYKVEYTGCRHSSDNFNYISSNRTSVNMPKISTPQPDHLIRLTWNDNGHQKMEEGDESIVEKNMWIYGDAREVFADKSLVFEEYWYYEKLRIVLSIKQIDDYVVHTTSYTNILLEKDGHF